MRNVLSSTVLESSQLSKSNEDPSSKAPAAVNIPSASLSKALLARIKTLKSKILAEEQSASKIEVEVSKEVSALRGRLQTAKDDRSSGDAYEDEAKKVTRIYFIFHANMADTRRRCFFLLVKSIVSSVNFFCFL